MDKKFTSTDSDIIFSKVKDKSLRKINYSQFEEAVRLIADKKGLPFEDLVNRIENEDASPKTNATQAEYNKFHDDKSLYTGVYAQGGPTNVDRGKDLSDITDRTPADKRGVKLDSSLKRGN